MAFYVNVICVLINVALIGVNLRFKLDHLLPLNFMALAISCYGAYATHKADE